MARYLIVKIDDDGTGLNSVVSRVRKTLHEFPEVSDMGVAGASPLTASERRAVVDAFENGMARAKEAQKTIEEDRALTPEGYNWVSGLLEPHRHLMKARQADALCMVTHDGARIRNGYKEKCPDCVALSGALL